MTRRIRQLLVAVALCLGVAAPGVGCHPEVVQQKLDPKALLVRGEYAKARAAALLRDSQEPEDRAIIALATIAETPTRASAAQAIETLTRGTTRIGAAAAASFMLELAHEIPQPVPAETSTELVLAALGAVGHGPLSVPNATQVPMGQASRDVATAALDRIESALASPDMSSIDTNNLLVVWNACFTLLGGNLEARTDAQAWTLFHSIGNIAVIMHKAAPSGDLSKVLLNSAIHTLESNPQIAIPARCDLASPYDDLKIAIQRDRDLRERLELAVAGAAGCSRGTHAPILP